MSINLGVFQMVELLNRSLNKRMHRSDVADEMQQHERTIRRWVENWNTIVDADLIRLPFTMPRIVTEYDADGRATLVLSQDDVGQRVFTYAAVHCAVEHVKAFDPDVLGAIAGDVLSDIGGDDPRSVVELVDKSFYYRPFGPKIYGDDRTLDRVVQATVNRNPMDVEYVGLASGKRSSMRVDPYTIVMYREGFYVLCRAYPSEQLRLLAVDRMQNVKRHTTEHFEVPEDFDPKAYFDGCFGLWKSRDEPVGIVLRFDPRAGHSARERSWVSDQEWSIDQDGHHVLRFEVPVTPELVGWLLSWGEMVEVVGPTSLREQVLQRVEDTRGVYLEEGGIESAAQ